MTSSAFHPIDLQAWPRGQMFYYFSQMAPTAYSLTVNLNITAMKSVLAQRKMKFFPAYLWLTTTMLNRQTEFKVAVCDDTLGYWDTLTPLYAAFHEDDKTFSLMWTEYHEDVQVFYQRYLNNQQQYGQQHGVLSNPDRLPPANSFTISCIPWIPFQHFALHSLESKPYYFPTLEAGQFFEQDGALLMPLSITAHHATTDGWHIKIFLTQLQEEMNHPDRWLPPSE